MTNIVDSCFKENLRYLLFSNNRSAGENADCLDDAFEEALKQSVFLFIYELKKFSLAKADIEKWENAYLSQIANNIRNQVAHQELHKLLSEAGIDYVILKGMASAKYYPDPLLRTMGDVDFLVKKSDVDRTVELLNDNGYEQRKEDNHSFHTAFKRAMITYELHWSCPGVPREGKEGDCVREYLADIIEKAECFDGYMVPSDFHHGLVLLLHSASHMTTTGMGLRHLCDWAVFSNKFSDSEFCDLFKEPLKEMGLWEYARVLTAVSIKYLGIDRKLWAEGVEEETVDLIMQDILDSGNFGVKDNQRINQAKLMRDDATRGVARGGPIKTLIRNLNVRSKRVMPITNKIPVLLPIGWVYVGVKHLTQIKAGKRSSINVAKTIRGAEKRSSLYSRLKLFEGER